MLCLTCQVLRHLIDTVESMRRITIEVPADVISQFGFKEKLLGQIKRCESVYILKYDRENFVSVQRIEMHDENMSPMSLVGIDGVVDIEVLYEENGVYTCIVRDTLPASIPEWFGGLEMLLDLPISYSNEKCVFSFLVKEKDFKRVMSDFSGLVFKVVRQEPVGREFLKSLPPLTERQRQIVRLAKKVGYFEIPRKTSSEKIAQMLGISKAAFLEHLRKVERTIFSNLTD